MALAKARVLKHGLKKGRRTLAAAPGPVKLRVGQRRILEAHVKAMQAAIRKGAIAGITGTMIFKGHKVFRRAFGYADLERKTPFTHDTICRIYCSSKSFIGFATAMLVEQGKLDLEAPLHRYIPAFRSMRVQGPEGDEPPVPAKKTILVRHLLLHCSGIGYGIDFNYPAEKKQERFDGVTREIEAGRIRTLAAFVDAVAKVPLYHEPGKQYEYSYSTDVLGRVLEVVCGKSLDALLKELIFTPLGMKDTGFAVPRQHTERLAGIYGNAKTWGHLHSKKPKAVPITSKPGLLRIDGTRPEESNWWHKNVKIYAGGGSVGHLRGGLVSTAADTEHWVRMLLDGGVTPSGQRLISRQRLAALERNQLVGELKAEHRWCILGDLVDGSAYQQGGAAGNYWLVDRKRNMGLVVMMQQVDGDDWEDWGINSSHADLDQVGRSLVDCKR